MIFAGFLFFVVFNPVNRSFSANSKQKTVSATVLWEGDFAGQFDFNGPLHQQIKGEVVEGSGTQIKPKNPDLCEIEAQFSEVVAKVGGRTGPAARVQFTFLCGNKDNRWTYQTPHYVIGLDRLSRSKTRVHLSEKMKNFSFVISNFSTQ